MTPVRHDPSAPRGSFDVGAWVERLDQQLLAHADPERAAHERRYLKSQRQHHGVPVPQVRKLAKVAARELPAGWPIEACRRLWHGPPSVHERRSAAVEVLRARIRAAGPEQLPDFEALIRDAHTWALVDVLAVHCVGAVVGRHREALTTLDRYAEDPDFWVRRTALLALLRHPEHAERFSRYADAMLDETEFFIRKAIGWVLRDWSRKHPQLVFDWLKPRAARCSGLTFREASRQLPQPMQAELKALRAG